VIPDYLEPITAFRCWRVQANGVLSGLAAAQPWAPKRTMVSVCNGHADARRGSPSEHLTEAGGWLDAPVWGCVCGIYATLTLENADTELENWRRADPYYGNVETPAYAVGEVSLWGRVIEHAVGYRAQFAYPKSLAVVGDDALAEKVSTLYGVPAVARQAQNPKPVWFTVSFDAAYEAQIKAMQDKLVQGISQAFAVPSGIFGASFGNVYIAGDDDEFQPIGITNSITYGFDPAPPLTFQQRKEKRKQEARERHKQLMLKQRRGWKKSMPWP
jgi:hypothetical protein